MSPQRALNHHYDHHHSLGVELHTAGELLTVLANYDSKIIDSGDACALLQFVCIPSSVLELLLLLS